jgi:hypothetical protein
MAKILTVKYCSSNFKSVKKNATMLAAPEALKSQFKDAGPLILFSGEE